MAYLEAMACGLPVVACAAGGAAEAIVHGETGILLESGSAEETASAIEMLLSDPQLRARMGDAGRERARSHFSLERYGARVADSYERAIEARQAAVVVW
jgi:glycosyltransferase involved in cell wall biosynthesis